jgi:hypothetical protein
MVVVMEEVDTATWVAVGEGAILDTMKNLNASLAKQVKMLEAEVRRLQQPDTLDLIVFGNEDRFAVAMAVPHGSTDPTWRDTLHRFQKNKDMLREKKIGFALVGNVQVGEMHESPFKLP